MAKHNRRRIRVKQTLKLRHPSAEFFSFVAAFGIMALSESLDIAVGGIYRWMRKQGKPSPDIASRIIGLSQTEKSRLKLTRALTWEDVFGRVEVERTDYA
jgi:hypothetical protein